MREMIIASIIGALMAHPEPPPVTTSDRPPIMADPHICVLERGAYCIIMGEGENIVRRSRNNTIIRIIYETVAGDVVIVEPPSCHNSFSIRPYIDSIWRRNGRISIKFHLNDRCSLTVSARDHYSEAIPRGIAIALTQIYMCTNGPCRHAGGLPLATLINRRALGWPD